MKVTLGVAVLVVMATVTPSSASSSDVPTPDKTALIMGGTGGPTPDEFLIESVINQFIAPTQPDQTIASVAVTTPEEFWPITGLIRLIGFAGGDPRIFGPGGGVAG